MKNSILTLSLIALLSRGINNSYSQNPKLSENSKLVIYGESDHMSKKQKTFMINSIDSLKKKGYNYFAIELPVKCDSSIQRYLTSNKNYQDENIKELLEWGPSNGALEVAYNFYKNGFKVVPIDEGKSFHLISLLNDYSILKTTKNPKRKINNERDFYMAKNIEKILENDSSAKIIAYTGAFHAREIKEKLKIKKRGSKFTYEYPTMAGILKKKGIDPETICLIDKSNNGYIDSEKEKLNKYFDRQIYLE